MNNTFFLIADPRPTGNSPQANVSGLHVSIDWSKCFILNGPLDTYELLENGVVAYSGERTQASRPNREPGGNWVLQLVTRLGHITILTPLCLLCAEYTYKVSATTIVSGERKTTTAPLVKVDVTGEGQCAVMLYPMNIPKEEVSVQPLCCTHL